MSVLLDPHSLANRPLLDGIQGNILKSHGRPHTANVFIHCRPNHVDEAKTWLHSLVEGEDALIQSGYAQLRSNLLWKENQAIDTGLFACIHISAAGYRYLFGDGKNTELADKPFQRGMKASAALLNDPDPESWESGFQAEIHFMLLLAYTHKDLLEASVDNVNRAIQSFADVTTIAWGCALKNAEGAGIEHFGYVDGISQPLFFEDEWETYKKNNNIKDEARDIKDEKDKDTIIKFDPRAAKELVLVKDPLSPKDPNAWGSYFVFRKLEQNVKGFKQEEAILAGILGFREEDDKERAGAMLVGRAEDGSPIELDKKPGLINSALLNNFAYQSGNNAKCPFHGHTRKTNPRVGPVEEGVQVANNRVMARRGIPYGNRTDDPNDGNIYNKPTDKVGLLFMSYQASIKDQFEFVQTQANDTQEGIDPVIGQGDRSAKGVFCPEWGLTEPTKKASFAQFVNLKGGEYFFAPSMSFLKNIHKG
ncbi:Dyp-type peroxidase [Spirosoma fluviale]|uniref:Dyp-type peroxidase family n=1 Tax=Spirosoma fluviale TaxID=1597977 RepID=A0A286G255_9BACT|nr:Dyp-type peroxidase [Spirosoma fluviale]SOD89595.1 Dyp-type peroxidase family [Spirosoma fluviale]